MTIASKVASKIALATFNWTMHWSFRRLTKIAREMVCEEARLAARRADLNQRAADVHAQMGGMSLDQRMALLPALIHEDEDLEREEHGIRTARVTLEGAIAEMKRQTSNRRPHLTIVKRKKDKAA
jgi:hypothetical protein